MTLIESLKGAPPIEAMVGNCEVCRYDTCCFVGLTPEQLPPWMRNFQTEIDSIAKRW
jgi:hypothetical protein